MWTKVHQVSFVQPGTGSSWSITFQIFDVPTRSGDIRDQTPGVPQVAKYNAYIHVFMCIQANDSSADFSWLYMQTGSRNPPKPEVVIA